MLVRLVGKDKLFADGSLRRRGDVWDAAKPWKYTEPVKGKAPVVDEPDEPETLSQLSRKEMMAQLTAAGVKFKPTLKSAELQALLDQTRNNAAPAASRAPSKEFQGTGNQDVI